MHLLKNERNHSSCLKIKSLTPTPFLALLCHLSCISFLKQPEQKAKKSSNYLGKNQKKKKKKEGKFCNSSKSLPIIQLGQHCSRDTGSMRGSPEHLPVPAHSGTGSPRRGTLGAGGAGPQHSRAGAGGPRGRSRVRAPGPRSGSGGAACASLTSCRAGSRKGRGKPGSKIAGRIESKHERGFSSLRGAGEALQGAALREPDNSSEPPTTMEKIKIKAKLTQNGVSSTC